MHISIQEGRSLPDFQRCTTCCEDFHCPFCASNVFHPAKLSKVQTHLESHFNRAVLYEGYTIHRCALNCKPRFHFHCFYCQSMPTRKADFIKHLALFKAKHSAITPIIPDPSTPSSQIHQPPSSQIQQSPSSQIHQPPSSQGERCKGSV
ncbi:TRMT1-like protein [Dissostichus eleginoides]|uniref:TRMT1-like protein n=1 Tax=Dissostichus eleginoides TaxID=100907 RepID=A0AAD9C5W0_DISEL|nr:TRMT1-like protein [Dissostichus eleginoides]